MNRTVLITGASRGIGRAISICFARNGYNVIATCKNNEGMLIGLQNEILALNKNIIFRRYVCDHSDFNSASELIGKIKKDGMAVDILINNAGVSLVGLAQDITLNEWNDLWNTNVTSVISMCKETIPLMLASGGGKIINISSVWGNVGASCEAAYSATKGAVNSYTKALSKELAPSNIQVNAISCGIIDTDMNAHLSAKEMAAIADDIPARKIGSPEDIAMTALSLSTAPSYLTGQIITVDGGWT